MPEIRDLLRDAAPDARAYDEDGVRARVAGRRRRRRAATGALLALVLVAGVGGAIALDGGDDAEPVVADQPTTSTPPAKVAGVTAVAFVRDHVWTGDETGRVGPEDGSSSSFAMPGPVRALATGDVLWIAGDTWVAAVDPVAGTDLGIWDTGDAVADIQPLEGQHVAISLPDSGMVAIVRTAAEGLEEIERIPLHGSPTNLVLTTGNDLWVDDGDVICLVDWGAGGAVDEQPWSGALLAPSMSGGIWAVDGDRVVDLDPSLLSQGQSVALGERYTVDATAVVETSFGLFVAGPAGLTRHEPGVDAAEVVDPDEPSFMTGSGDRVAYVVGGMVRTAQGHSAANGGTETTPSVSGNARIGPEGAVVAYLRVELGWPDAVIDDGATVPNADGTMTLSASSPSLGREVTVGMAYDDEWSVIWLSTFPGDVELHVVRHADGSLDVDVDHQEPGIVAHLTLRRAGQRENSFDLVAGDGDAMFHVPAENVPDDLSFIQVLFTNDDGVAVDGIASGADIVVSG